MKILINIKELSFREQYNLLWSKECFGNFVELIGDCWGREGMLFNNMSH